MNNKILIIEDDISISEMVKNYLKKEGFIATTACNGEDGIAVFLKDNFDLIVLDLMMPKLDGIETIKIIREKSSVPILIMSAKDSDVDKAIGLGFGADDYITKPFSMIEISARIKAAIRRSTKYSNNKQEIQIIKIGNLTVDLNNFLVSKNGQTIQLTSKEFDILKLFIKNPNRVFTKAQIYNLIWEDDYFGDENVINVHMRRLREKIEDNPSKPQYIKTLWGIGYKLEVN
ncbi:DNA-binding response regulator [Clostridium pasteurianum DSM 525 = ATCC 6013]|uniref:Stage 0 sporulation protein A homolog n=1 Tax=Clostridium pasteurianum DSM 525 = ATCC 6013 TaxID=1262449 RepID=A0A0H3JAV3_CLOPA|nr:response regulator transcription factor [Clostridium pasteurianum]AJA49883.1 DNA-binding response regulator [Clostridium pasteurianum DSM 525 = ATCC 6013]AJA53871.1 DNA-binding response regulator [Clostridium pasteurianum DSM 525 = ATCC 6013]AOZ77026.1 PhoP family transcriptional regulator [Clostridium pasteurianum DSM 525 = ATCC 6013]AOZ80823.1 PhoP family transcriptional regulator [Clostridium pasteurianum]ELP57843.1 two-component response regulator ycbL [Clostridium pasteurianum DSM 525 